MKHMLSSDVVRERLAAYQAGKTEVTDQLYEFGLMLLNETVSRNDHLESKAGATLGFSGAILAFLISRARSWLVDMHGWERGVLAFAAASALVAAIAGFSALLVSRLTWFSDSQWFVSASGLMNDPDRLKRFHLAAIHLTNQKLNAANDIKARRVALAQRALGLATIGLAAALSMRLVSVL